MTLHETPCQAADRPLPCGFAAPAVPADLRPCGLDGTTTAYVNLRTGPGTDYTILETVPLGAQISILDTGNPGWYRVTAPSGNSGYMCSDYILASGGDAGTSTVLFTARTTAFVNLRAGPGTGYGIYLTVPLGDTVSVLDTANAGWYACSTAATPAI